MRCYGVYVCGARQAPTKIDQAEVDPAAAGVRDWQGTEAELLLWLQARHGWTAASEYSPHYLAAVRAALEASD